MADLSLGNLGAYLADVRRRVSGVSDGLAALHDSDLLWLVANGWQPPAGGPARHVWGDGWRLTTAQYEAYRRTVAEAQQIRDLLTTADRVGGLGIDSSREVGQLRAALRQKAAELQAMVEEWELA